MRSRNSVGLSESILNINVLPFLYLKISHFIFVGLYNSSIFMVGVSQQYFINRPKQKCCLKIIVCNYLQVHKDGEQMRIATCII